MDQLQIIKDLKNLLVNKFPDCIDKVILFGADYDWKLENKILNVGYDIDLKYEILTDVKFISNEELKTIKGKQPFIITAFEKGLVV